MVDDFDASLLSRTVSPSDLGVRVSVVCRGVLHKALKGHDDPEGSVIGPRFIGHVAMAAHDELVVIGHVSETRVEVWTGSGRQLTCIAGFDAPVPAGGLVALVSWADQWHLFARNEVGRSSHFVSNDLRSWTVRDVLSVGFPAFAVSGAAVSDGDLLLAGRVFVDNTAFGWGLLRSDGHSFQARPVPLPLATQLSVLGPTVNSDGDTVLVLDSGHNRTIATSTGAGWALSQLVPDITPTASFANGAALWLVGNDNADGAPSLAKVNDGEIIALPASPLGKVRSAVVHGHHLVLAREC